MAAFARSRVQAPRRASARSRCPVRSRTTTSPSRGRLSHSGVTSGRLYSPQAAGKSPCWTKPEHSLPVVLMAGPFRHILFVMAGLLATGCVRTDPEVPRFDASGVKGYGPIEFKDNAPTNATV